MLFDPFLFELCEEDALWHKIPKPLLLKYPEDLLLISCSKESWVLLEALSVQLTFDDFAFSRDIPFLISAN
jgi:hypothetical protein